EQAKGKAKEVTGKVTDDESLEWRGRAQKHAGDMRADYGDAKENIDDALERDTPPGVPDR
uniref:CsbD family protein n=1 Tax=Klebsiella pneumoniae TaxID=573 RepID=UPI001330657B